MIEPEFEPQENDDNYDYIYPDDWDDNYSPEDAELYIGITAQSKRQF